MRNKKFLLPISLAVFSLTACNIFDNSPWSWEISTDGYTINYCLLIGQIDHNDSMYRTRGTREALDTRVKKEHQKVNFNLEDVKTGHIKLGEGTPYEHDFTVRELESLEQKSFAGATWDPITANTTSATWINKHGEHITCFVSNNDGMAEGAIHAYNWKKNMPIFGYDSNTSTLRLMQEEGSSIKGTIDSNTAGQCLVTSVLIRNIYEASQPTQAYAKNGTARSLIQKMWEDENTPYNPIYDGFQYVDGEKENEKYLTEVKTVKGESVKFDEDQDAYYTDIKKGTGYVQSTVTFDGCMNKDLTNPSFDENNQPSHHAILLKNRSVTNDCYTSEIDDSAIPTDYFFDDKGDALDSAGLFNKAEGDYGGRTLQVKPNSGLSPISLCQTWYSKTDTFFTSNMNPLFEITQAENMFNIRLDYPCPGDGADEKVVLDQMDPALTEGQSSGPKAFLINPVQQPNSLQYIEKIAENYKIKKQDNWIDRSDIPVIFWNRQPTDIQGNISTEDVMNNKYFKYTYYVGFDAKQGGELQGNMVKAWLNKTYLEQSGGLTNGR